jgi:diguanylate cyclase (GGDEF)-like protein
VAERIRDSVRGLKIPSSDASRCVTVSIGVAYVPATTKRHENAVSEVVTAADEALYMAKRQGRDRVCRVDPRSRNPAARSSCATGVVGPVTSDAPIV